MHLEGPNPDADVWIVNLFSCDGIRSRMTPASHHNEILKITVGDERLFALHS